MVFTRKLKKKFKKNLQNKYCLKIKNFFNIWYLKKIVFQIFMKPESLNVFNKIYSESVWGIGSGSGSELEYCKSYINFLQKFFYDYSIKSIVDLGCGDWQFTKEINFTGIKYLGIDAAKEVIAENIKSHATENIKFNTLKRYQDIPSCDLLICKDVMQHLSIKENKKIIKEVFPKFKYILSTNCVSHKHLWRFYIK